MKTILCLFLCILFRALLISQNSQLLVGAHSSGSNQVFSSFDIENYGYVQLSTLPTPYNDLPFEKTYDNCHHRYFIKRGSKLFILDATNGQLVDSIVQVSQFHNFEYDEKENRLFGIRKIGNAFSSESINLTTKLSTIHASLIGVDSLVYGESTFDALRRRYFTLTNLGLTALDSNGIINDVLCSSPTLFGMEYNPLTNKLLYLENKFGVHDVVSIEANICNIEVLNSLNTVTFCVRGESTFNKQSGEYFNKTNSGILKISTQNGQILQTIPAVNNFGGIELDQNLKSSLSKNTINQSTFSIYPNPFHKRFSIKIFEPGSEFEIYNSQANLFYKTTLKDTTTQIDLSDQTEGIYFFKLTSVKGKVVIGKLVLQ